CQNRSEEINRNINRNLYRVPETKDEYNLPIPDDLDDDYDEDLDKFISLIEQNLPKKILNQDLPFAAGPAVPQLQRNSSLPPLVDESDAAAPAVPQLPRRVLQDVWVPQLQRNSSLPPLVDESDAAAAAVPQPRRRRLRRTVDYDVPLMEEVLSPAEIERIRKRGRRLRNVDYDVPLMEEVLSPDEIERIRRNYPHVPPVVPPYVQPNVDQEMPPPVPEMPAAEVPWEENRAFFDDFVVRNRDVVGDGQFFYNQTDIWGQNILSRYPELIESMDRMTIIDKRNTANLIAQHANAAMNLLNDWRTAPSSIDPMWDRIEQMLLNVVNQMNLFRDQALLQATQS
ncbi:MAG: hypothetical protein EB127_31750, partial [Alphaproteobacteria bacterium]|nr:hypothetical protein [Alphaproteobacteria bacterium]